jgi:hypothetical protein
LNTVTATNCLFTMFTVFFYFICPSFPMKMPTLLVVKIRISSTSVPFIKGYDPISIGKF